MDGRYEVYRTKKDTVILAYINKNYETMELSMKVTGITKEGLQIPGRSIKMTKLYKDMNCLDFLMDSGDGMELGEVNTVREILMEKLGDFKVMGEGNPAKAADYYPLITEYIKAHGGKDGILIENGYGFIPSKDMEEVIHSLEGCENCRKEDFVMILAMQDVLKTNNNRNSIVKAVGNERIRYYGIRMPEKKSEVA